MQQYWVVYGNPYNEFCYSWDECVRLIGKDRHNLYQVFNSFDEARKALDNPPLNPLTLEIPEDVGEPFSGTFCVSGTWDERKCNMGWRIAKVKTGEVIKEFGPYPCTGGNREMTYVATCLAIVEGLRFIDGNDFGYIYTHNEFALNRIKDSGITFIKFIKPKTILYDITMASQHYLQHLPEKDKGHCLLWHEEQWGPMPGV